MRKTVYKPKKKFEKPVVEEVSDDDSFGKRFYDKES
jgi:nitrogen fixation protein